VSAKDRTRQDVDRGHAPVDRAHAPGLGPAPSFAPPALEETQIGGVRAAVVRAPRLEFCLLQVGVGAGHRFTPARLAGRAAMIGDVLSEGTQALDGTALVDELDGLGAELDVRVDDDEVIVEMVVLARHLERGAALLSELLLEPRFDAEDFERARRQRLASILARRADAGVLAAEAWRAALFGAEHPLGAPPSGTEASLSAMTVDALREAWGDALRAGNLRLAAIGPFDAERTAASLPRLAALPPGAHAAGEVQVPPEGERAPGHRVTIVDRPGSPQTQIRVGHRAVPAGHPDFFALSAMNHPFGGSISSRLSRNLREERGWTYGVRSGFQGGKLHGWFQIASAVESGVAGDAVLEVVAELERLVDGGLRDDEVEFTRAALGRTLLRQYESAGAKAAYAANVGKFMWPPDYPARRLAWIQAMDANALHALARQHLNPASLDVVCVGDRAALERAFSTLTP